MSSDEGSVALEAVESEFETAQVEDNEAVEVEADEANDNQQDDNKKVVKPKRVVKNPQPKLNEQTLRGPKGLTSLQGYFEKVHFKGKGYEDQDLNVLLKTYEYWCHRMFPKYPFDASIARLEVLGGKKATQTYLKRIRMDLIFDDEEVPVEENVPTDGFVDPVETTESQFDQLLTGSSSRNDSQPNQITEEQLERIRQNKERAERLRQERMRKIREKAAENLEESQYLSQTNTVKEINSEGLSGGSYLEDDRTERLEENASQPHVDSNSEVHTVSNQNNDNDCNAETLDADYVPTNECSETQQTENPEDNELVDNLQETGDPSHEHGSENNLSDVISKVIMADEQSNNLVTTIEPLELMHITPNSIDNEDPEQMEI